MKFWAKAANQKAELYIYDTIGADFFGDGITAKSVSDALKDFRPGAALDVYINSPGGSVFDGVAIYNQLMRWNGKKVVHIDGLAASIASVIAMAGDEIRIAENGLMMIHKAWGFCMGNDDDMLKYAASLKKVSDTISTTYVGRTKSDAKQIETWMAAETWMNADEAVERGFADVKTGEKAMKAEFAMLAKFSKVPEQLKRQAQAPDTLRARMDMRTQHLNRRPAGATA
ncbi:MAG: head maturation protease, ClpP-related [Aquincola tertiaricarbonis]